MKDRQDSPVGPRFASWVALALFVVLLFGGGALLLAENLDTPKSTETKTVETTQLVTDASGKRTSTTTMEKTTLPAAEPSAVERLASPRGTLIAKLLVLFAVAFLAAAGTQRALLGRYAIKIAGVEVPEIPPAAANSIGDTAKSLGGQATMVGANAEPAPENREPEEDITVDVPDTTSGLVQLRFELERVLRSLAVPPPIHRQTAITLIGILTQRGVLPYDLQASLINIVQAGDLAAAGSKVPPVVRSAAEQSGPYILQTLALQRRTAAQAFENHVLDVLTKAVGPGEVTFDTLVGTTRYDAVVRHAGQTVVVEVRARLDPKASKEFQAVVRLVNSLPPELPLILVAPGAGITPRQLAELNGARSGALEIVRWDEEWATFGPRVRAAIALSG